MKRIFSTLLKRRGLSTKVTTDATTFMHYSSDQQILVAGDGDFGFSSCVARHLTPASGIIATSIDSYDLLVKKYPNAAKNVSDIQAFGASVLHSVNVRIMKDHPLLSQKQYDAIVFNFPHAGFKWKEDDSRMILKHISLVEAFMENANELLKPDGEVHVTHKIGGPYDKWLIEKQAALHGFKLREKVNFSSKDYPGYYPKFGAGRFPGDSFPVGPAKTFKFVKLKQD